MNRAGQVKIVGDKLHLSSGCSLDKLSSLAYFKHCITPRGGTLNFSAYVGSDPASTLH